MTLYEILDLKVPEDSTAPDFLGHKLIILFYLHILNLISVIGKQEY